LQEFEVPALVLITNHIDGKFNNILFSRCISTFILVCNEDQILKLSIDPGMSEIIPVFGKATFFR